MAEVVLSPLRCPLSIGTAAAPAVARGQRLRRPSIATDDPDQGRDGICGYNRAVLLPDVSCLTLLMLRRKRHFRLTAWLAIFAMLLGALAPAVSQAMTVLGDGNLRWVEVCSGSGMAWVAVDAKDVQKQDGEPAKSTASCAYCCPHAGSVGLPPAPLLDVAAAGVPALEPLLFLSAPRPLFAWSASSPRAPPAAS